MTSLSDRINRHEHPSWLLRYPQLIQLIFAWFALVYQRVSVVRRELRRHLPKGHSFRLIDAGCGEGLYLLWLARRYPKAHLTGIDINAHNIQLLKHYLARTAHTRVEAIQADLQTQPPPCSADYVLCVGVLHCVANDVAFLRNLAQSTQPHAKLLLYSPLKPRRIWPCFERWYGRWHHYEAIHAHHTYTPQLLRQRLAQGGWQIESWQGTMGHLAAAGFECYTLCFTGALHASQWWASAILGALILPTALIAAGLQRLDRLFSPTCPNGVWIVARKTDAHPEKQHP